MIQNGILLNSKLLVNLVSICIKSKRDLCSVHRIRNSRPCLHTFWSSLVCDLFSPMSSIRWLGQISWPLDPYSLASLISFFAHIVGICMVCYKLHCTIREEVKLGVQWKTEMCHRGRRAMENKTASPSLPVWAALTTDSVNPYKNLHLVRCYIINREEHLNRVAT